MGPEMESVLPNGPTVIKQYTRDTKRQKVLPPPGFMEAYNKLKKNFGGAEGK